MPIKEPCNIVRELKITQSEKQHKWKFYRGRTEVWLCSFVFPGQTFTPLVVQTTRRKLKQGHVPRRWEVQLWYIKKLTCQCWSDVDQIGGAPLAAIMVYTQNEIGEIRWVIVGDDEHEHDVKCGACWSGVGDSDRLDWGGNSWEHICGEVWGRCTTALAVAPPMLLLGSLVVWPLINHGIWTERWTKLKDSKPPICHETTVEDLRG